MGVCRVAHVDGCPQELRSIPSPSLHPLVLLNTGKRMEKNKVAAEIRYKDKLGNHHSTAIKRPSGSDNQEQSYKEKKLKKEDNSGGSQEPNHKGR